MARIDLHGEWTLVRVGNGAAVPAQVPGDNISALLEAGAIPDPYVGMNELDVQWVGREDWVFRREVVVPPALLREEAVFLTFESLDTVATVLVNGVTVGESDNMFVRWRREVKSALKAGANTIEVRFRSPENEALERSRRLPYPVPTGGAPVFSPHRNLVRKVQCHAGWDWGCCLMVSGIYGEAWLEATSAVVIEHVYTEQFHAKGRCRVVVAVEATAVLPYAGELDIRLGEATARVPVRLAPGRQTVFAEVTVRNPQLWWPNGEGGQPLYDLTVRLGGATARRRLGLRTLELVAQEDAKGLSCWFRVNGRPVFCKGANWIPADALPRRHTRETYADLLGSAAEAHMNMLRVWGGGQYEREDFYDLCDEKGLLIWHDFMFSCSLYPASEEFLHGVAAEAEYQVKRLRDHACVALWCGNNEDLGALGWFQESRQHRDRYLVDYDRLNEGVLGRAVDAFDPTRTFWPSSPCGGRGDYSDNWHDDRRGDMHYWSVWHEGKSFDAYYRVTPRFCSEFGYQSFPSLETIRRYAGPSELNVTSPVMEHHQRNTGGNSKIIEMFSRYFRMPSGFANFVYLSQVQQALAIKTAVEYWRHLRPVCMGTLYWQLNDVWPVCSWASLEYGGKWKLLHYAAKRFYAPVLLSAFQKDGQLEVWLTNDRPQTVKAEIELRVMDFAGRELKRLALDARVAAGAAKRVKACAVGDLVARPQDGFLFLTLRCGGEVSHNEHFFTEWKRCELGEAGVRATVTPDGAGLTVEVRAARPAFFVCLEAEGLPGRFSDNGFTVLPGEVTRVRFTPARKVTPKAFAKSLKVYDLRSTY